MAPLLQRQELFRGTNVVFLLSYVRTKRILTLWDKGRVHVLKWVVMYRNHRSWKGYADYVLNVHNVSSQNSCLLGFDVSSLVDMHQGSRQTCSLSLLP